MPKLASKNEAEDILRLQGADTIYRKGINSLAGVFPCGIDAELAAEYLKKQGYKAHSLVDLEAGTGVCVMGIHD